MAGDTIPSVLKSLLTQQFESCGECVDAAYRLFGVHTFKLSWQIPIQPEASSCVYSLDPWLSPAPIDLPPAPVNSLTLTAQVQQLANHKWAWVPDRPEDQQLVEYLRMEGWE